MKILVKCSTCGESIERQGWNYTRNAPVDNFFCNAKCKGNWQRKQRELLGYNKDWLMSEYITNGKSADQIAAEIGRDPKSVWTWISDYGIPTRPRGTDYGQTFKVGSPSRFKGRKHTQETKDMIRQKRIEDGHVPYLINGVHWLKATGRKPASWCGGVTPERQAFYSTEEWSVAVKEVWRRDNGICRKCGAIHNNDLRGTFHIHHVVSFANEELRADIDNLMLLCRDCHKWVHSKKNKNRDFIREC